jgi:hypothetical protein
MPYAQSRKYSILQEQRVPDGVLVEQALAGDQCAFEFLVNRYHHQLVCYIRGLLKENGVCGAEEQKSGLRAGKLILLATPALYYRCFQP